MTLLCKACGEEKGSSSFSAHSGCVSGYDTSRCKSCKKSAYDWAQVPIERRIYNRIKTRAKHKGIEFNLSLEDIVLPSECPVFRVPFDYGHPDWTYSVDRIAPDKGYTKGNILIVSNKANRIKSDATPEELRIVAEFYCEIV